MNEGLNVSRDEVVERVVRGVMMASSHRFQWLCSWGCFHGSVWKHLLVSRRSSL